ncbi:hypothetical protein D9615_001019 [Tricholomella constricta]|uniref:F-box domain-containing protein n=1 Tax=Tricholomella constricta TaxID=117010 RepID=A0A8H5M979_9AGAR|nr:hypothetical protein D9615_001019 [Tricholomella constricta]
MNMKLCPPEIHSYICELACLDDGRAVQALSLVSRYFRDIARPFLYQSLSISGSDKISMLASELETTPPHLRSMRHLFISTHPTSGKLNNEPTIPSTGLESTAILRILTLAAPTLETLSFVSASPAMSTSSISRLFRTSFPRLRELSVAGFYPFPSSPGKMPSLERLHLHGNRNPHGLLQMGGLDEACPSLTHLRVSGLSMAVSFALELQEAFSGVETSPFPSKLPPGVRHVVLEPAPPFPFPASGKPAASHARDQLMMEQLEDLTPPQGVEFSLLARADAHIPCDTFRRDWIERLDGTEGCWATSVETTC